MLSPSMAIRDRAHDRAHDDQTGQEPLTTLRDATDVLTQQDVGRTIPAKFLLRKSTTPAWIAMIATELD